MLINNEKEFHCLLLQPALFKTEQFYNKINARINKK